jgi:hypothetical protein
MQCVCVCAYVYGCTSTHARTHARTHAQNTRTKHTNKTHAHTRIDGDAGDDSCMYNADSLSLPPPLPPSSFAVYLSQPYRRGDGIMVDKMTTPPAYLSQSKDNVRAVVNRVKLLVDPPGARGRRHDVDTVSSRRSVDGSVKMGGGFVYRSNIEIDFTRPTPSRPTYSHGLFLFPFSNELATKMLNTCIETWHSDVMRVDHAPGPRARVLSAAVPKAASQDVQRKSISAGAPVRPSDLRGRTPPERQRTPVPT